jgi:RecA-family ATPase
MLLCGPTGIGKSSFALQCAILWALGRECFGIASARPLKSLLIQAENDDGDLAEMRDGVIAGLSLSSDMAKMACENIIVVRENSRTAVDFFISVVRPLLAEHRPDILWMH